MGYEVEWTDRALYDFQVLQKQQGLEKLLVLKAVAGRRHAEWLSGRPFRQFELLGEDIRLLEIGNVGIVYALIESQDRVRLLAILRNIPA